jgi:hypothetical protein
VFRLSSISDSLEAKPRESPQRSPIQLFRGVA